MGHTILAGWLATAARLESLKAARHEARRRDRETHAGDMNAPNESTDAAPARDELQLVLDDAMGRLGAAEREAVLLRYFSAHSFAEVGRALHISEEAARKRVDRAVDKLRAMLGRRGLVSTSAMLGTALGAHAAPSVADNFVAMIAAGAWQPAAISAATPLAVFMSSTKIIATAAGVALLLAATSVVRDASLRASAETGRDRAPPNASRPKPAASWRNRKASATRPMPMSAPSSRPRRIRRAHISRIPPTARPRRRPSWRCPTPGFSVSAVSSASRPKRPRASSRS
ncbi:MAG: sigma-70 family RNA polymerase sigma factor [Undibacterium sp.]|nr:sigma-70 family RNA polymerase sigma factor [Opitutaceae bacterium]